MLAICSRARWVNDDPCHMILYRRKTIQHVKDFDHDASTETTAFANIVSVGACSGADNGKVLHTKYLYSWWYHL